MTEEERQEMKKFEAKVRQVIAQVRALKRENSDLYTEIEGKAKEIKRLKEELAQRRDDYNNLKLAKMMEICDTDIKESKMKITRLVREINNCIGILSTEAEINSGDINTQAN